MSIYAIIPAGGAGTRLWPLSRRSKPKFLIDLLGHGKTLIQATASRLAPLSQEIFVVTGVAHSAAVAEHLPQISRENIFAEPSPRDSMAAIGLAAAVIQKRYGDVVVGSFAADHLIADQLAFEKAVQEAEAAAQAGYLVTIGIDPDHPATGFGYIQTGAPLPGFDSARKVQTFTEKPDSTLAQQYFESGEYRWNAGMFIARTSVLMDSLKRFEPELAAGISQIAQAYDSPDRELVISRVWPGLKKIAIDHAIAEPLAAAGGMAVVPVSMGWSDVGDYASLRDVLSAGTAGEETDVLVQASPGGSLQQVIAVSSPGALAYTYSKPITIAGIANAVVVETSEAILVTTRENAQSVKDVVAKLADADLEDLA